jgi:hypothetical protein
MPWWDHTVYLCHVCSSVLFLRMGEGDRIYLQVICASFLGSRTEKQIYQSVNRPILNTLSTSLPIDFVVLHCPILDQFVFDVTNQRLISWFPLGRSARSLTRRLFRSFRCGAIRPGPIDAREICHAWIKSTPSTHTWDGSRACVLIMPGVPGDLEVSTAYGLSLVFQYIRFNPVD